MSGYIINFANLNVTAIRQVAIDAIKANILGIRDIQAIQGMVPGWKEAFTGTSLPSRIMWSSTQAGGLTEWVAMTSITYSANEVISSATYQYSNDSTNGTDGTWTNLTDSGTLKTCSYTYDVNGDLTSTTWS